MARAKKTVAKRAAAREAAGTAGDRTVASNRRARHDYDILDTFEAGIVLQGSEVKSLREGKAQLSDAYARVSDGELWLFGVHIPRGTSPPGSGPTTRTAGASSWSTARRSTSSWARPSSRP